MLRNTLIGVPQPLAGWLRPGPQPALIHLTAAGAGPVGGDRLQLDIRVGAESALVLGEVSPTLLLPGPHGEQSRTRINITVEPGATLVWLPQLVIAAHGCRHRTDIHVSLAADARLLLREEVLFGRHGESPGTLHQRLRITVSDTPRYDQELAIGPEAPGWNGPAITAGHRCAGTLIVVDPAATLLPNCAREPTSASATMTLPGPGTVTSTLADDTATLRKHLDTALDSLIGQRAHARPARPTRENVPTMELR